MVNCVHICVFYSEENVALYDRLVLMRLCERMTGKMVKSRTNVILVRQNRLTSGNGVVLFYQSVKKSKVYNGGELLQTNIEELHLNIDENSHASMNENLI